MFEIRETKIKGCLEIIPKVHEDMRGSFVKTFHADALKEHLPDFEIMEQYYSWSKKGVLRGLHFQVPPHDHGKLVYCPVGYVIDAVLDIRAASSTYGQSIFFELDANMPKLVFVPKGCAHGFFVKSEQALMIYNVSTVYHPEADKGIHWNSIEWPEVLDPIVSERDETHPKFDDFENLF